MRKEQYDDTIECALRLDRDDAIAGLRDEFLIPAGTTYLCGNCLGMQPKSAMTRVTEVMAGWAEKGFRAHFTEPQNWLSYEQENLTRRMAYVVGAKPAEVSVMNSLTVNLHLMMISFYRPTPDRFKILIEEGAFPSDRFAIESQIKLHGYSPEQALIYANLAGKTGKENTESVVSKIEECGHEVALVLLGNSNYRTGLALDMEAITRAGHRMGCAVGFDLAHAAGNLELKLHEWSVDFAVWCTYKYLNGGPGSPGGCFVHERHAHAEDMPRLHGWWGKKQETRFDMRAEAGFDATPGAQGWQMSSAPILAMASLSASLELFERAGMGRLREKSVRLGDYLQALADKHLQGLCESLTPRNSAERGCQFTFKVKADPRELQAWLLERGIVCDAHGEDMIRVSPAPLYNTFQDIHRLSMELRRFFDARETRVEVHDDVVSNKATEMAAVA